MTAGPPFASAPDSVSIILLTNGKPEFLAEVLDSLIHQDYRPLEVLVALNGLVPEVDRILELYSGRVKVLRNDRDLGFACGMNRAVETATGTYVYLTANDIVLPADYVRRLVISAQELSGWGVLSGVWYNYDKPNAVVGAGGTLEFGLSTRPAILTKPLDEVRPYDVDWVSGASVFINSGAWRALRGFRDDFFAHYEDVDLCLRVRRNGGYVRVLPAAKLYHHEHSRGLSSSHRIEYYKLRNYLAVTMLYGPVSVLPWVALKFLFYTTPRIAAGLKSPRFYFRTLKGVASDLPSWVRERARPSIALRTEWPNR